MYKLNPRTKAEWDGRALTINGRKALCRRIVGPYRVFVIRSMVNDAQVEYFVVDSRNGEVEWGGFNTQGSHETIFTNLVKELEERLRPELVVGDGLTEQQVLKRLCDAGIRASRKRGHAIIQALGTVDEWRRLLFGIAEPEAE